MASQDLYTKTSYELAGRLTKRYSTSFSMSSRLFDKGIRPHVYAIYGMVRVADEIVDSYRGDDAAAQLYALHADVLAAIKHGYSANPLLHAFAVTARQFAIDDSLIGPFFESMQTDLAAKEFDDEAYGRYIYGSAEVIGLMCLRVFAGERTALYDELKSGAQRLGAAYQKVNFLRDMQADYRDLGRMYFPGVTFERFGEAEKAEIIQDIKADFAAARPMVERLPDGARMAVRASYLYYRDLLKIAAKTPATALQSRRIRVPDWKKFLLLLRARLGA